jgi:type IV pilus assembly protein PilY1
MSNQASKVVALILAVLQIGLPGTLYSAPVVTAPVALDDQPINTSSSVKPNLMFTLDNSGSMDSKYAPEDAANNESKYCYLNNNYNALFYNPGFTYQAPVLGDGSRMPDAVYTAALKDGFHPADGTINLQTKFSALGTYNYGLNDYGTQNRGGYYAKYNDATVPLVKGTCYADSKYVIVDMNAATTAQKQNYANWFSYYRTRLLAMKSAAGEAFRAIGDDFRVGFHTIAGENRTDEYGGFLVVDTFTGAHRNNWYNMFYRQYAAYGTPLRPAMTRIGEYFRAGTSPSGASVPDPVQYSCQPNYHILSTDGLWNGGGGSGVAASQNWNNTLPNNPDLLAALTTEFGTPFTAGQPWPKPYREKVGTGSTNTLADIAAYYWQTDLRPLMPNNVPTSSKDSATWQHVTQFSLAFSPGGLVPYPNGINQIKAGTLEWPLPVSNTDSAVDDLWAAAIVGHGQYFNVNSPEELLNKLSAALQDIAGRQASGSPSASTANDYEYATSPYAFRASYLPGEWTGKLEARAVNVNAGGSDGSALWDAADKLDTQVLGLGWDGNRRIATMNTASKTAVPFRWANLSTPQQLSLDVDPLISMATLEYLRGNQAKEENAPVTSIPAPTTISGQFRSRSTVLGALINSKPHYEAGPNSELIDAYNPGYSTFKTAKANRTPMIYVGASDGMLHAFKATVGDVDSGTEKWAYVPGMLYRDGADGLASWAWKYADPLPKKFSHRFRVDQSPKVTDVDFGRTGSPAWTPDWNTLLVAGMNKGGKGYFALNVTNPDATTEADAVAKVLWEFTGEVANDPKMGYTFGAPMVVKTRRFGWVVAVTSGYNNAAGTGHLWLLSPKTGAVLHRFDTGAGTVAAPSGLGPLNAYWRDETDRTADNFYAADLLGNVWRFDVASPNSSDFGYQARLCRRTNHHAADRHCRSFRFKNPLGGFW